MSTREPIGRWVSRALDRPPLTCRRTPRECRHVAASETRTARLR